MHPAMSQLTQLSVAERLELVQDLWDSIGSARDQMPVQEWHREMVKARLDQEGNGDQLPGLSREEMWQQVDQRRGS